MFEKIRKKISRLLYVQETEEEMKRREKDIQELDKILGYCEEHPELLDRVDRFMREERKKTGPNVIVF
jgi:hypothetical protein